MRIGLAAALATTILVAQTSAWADDECMNAPVEAQKLQKSGKLLEARARFLTCARPTCPAEIVRDCTQWVHDVEQATPSVVIAGRDADGHDLADVQVFIDGNLVTVSPQAIPLDPGPHTFLFKRAGSADLEDHATLHEGEKNRNVIGTFGGGATTGPTPGTTSRPVPAGVWVTGIAGLVGLGVFGVFGAIGVSDRSANHCDTGCPQAQKDDVDTKFLIADIGLAVGVVGLAVATIWFFARPSVTIQRTGHVATFGFRF
jgi:hypothetical protein